MLALNCFKVLKFNTAEHRDQHGKWTATGRVAEAPALQAIRNKLEPVKGLRQPFGKEAHFMLPDGSLWRHPTGEEHAASAERIGTTLGSVLAAGGIRLVVEGRELTDFETMTPMTSTQAQILKDGAGSSLMVDAWIPDPKEPFKGEGVDFPRGTYQSKTFEGRFTADSIRNWVNSQYQSQYQKKAARDYFKILKFNKEEVRGTHGRWSKTAVSNEPAVIKAIRKLQPVASPLSSVTPHFMLPDGSLWHHHKNTHDEGAREAGVSLTELLEAGAVRLAFINDKHQIGAFETAAPITAAQSSLLKDYADENELVGSVSVPHAGGGKSDVFKNFNGRYTSDTIRNWVNSHYKKSAIDCTSIFKWDKNEQRDDKGKWTTGGNSFAKVLTSVDTPSYRRADPMNVSGDERNTWFHGKAPQATGFENVMRVIGDPPVGKPGFTNTPNLVRPVAKVKPLTPLSKETKVTEVVSTDGGANTSAFLTFEDGTKAVYKPERGEQWPRSSLGGFTNDSIDRYMTNKKLSLAEREAMAYEVDQKLGLGLVPETIHRHELDLDGVEGAENLGSSGSDNPSSGHLQTQYDSYREKAQEDAYNVVGEQMQSLFHQAKKDHAQDVKNRVEEVQGIWDDLVKDYPQARASDEESFDPAKQPYGSETQVRNNPVLPIENAEPITGELHYLNHPAFVPKFPKNPVDPMEILDEAEVGMDYKLNDREQQRVTELLKNKLEQGYLRLGSFDTQAAQEHLDYYDWMENHSDTENNLLDQQIMSFDQWKKDQGVDSGEVSKVKNPEAPHPKGGSLQRFADGAGDSYALDNFSQEDHSKIAILDYAIGAMDRHGGNVLTKDTDNSPVAIDNGYSFPNAPGPDSFSFRSRPTYGWLRRTNPDLQDQLEKVNEKIYAAHGAYRDETGGSEAQYLSMEKGINGLREQYDKIQDQIAQGPPTPESVRTSTLAALKKADWNKFVTVDHPDMSKLEREGFLGRIHNLEEALQTPTGLAKLWKAQDQTY